MDYLCNFPKLSEKYDRALREAVSFVLERFKPVGIIAAGTVVRGTPDATSDLDVWVIHMEPFRQRLQKFFVGVPAEIFVNPPWVIQKYFVQDQAEARPISAHMMATGTVVLATDPVVEQLRQTAISLLSSSPTLTSQRLTQARYAAATTLEDAVDIVERNPAAAIMLASEAVRQMLHFAFLKAGRFIPRDKDVLDALRSMEPDLATKAQLFFDSVDWTRRMHLANELADHILEVRGFFEWNGELEEVPQPEA
jgi:predicted nucleotidyltransferase